MSWHGSGEVQVASLEVSACFSEEEWKLLQEWQKVLYRNVMKEIHQALISLGPLIATTVCSLREKEKEEMCSLDTERRRNMNHSPTDDMMNNQNLVFRINSEEKLNLNNPPDPEGRRRNRGLIRGFPCLDTDVIVEKEEEPVSILIDHLGEEIRPSSTNRNLGHDVVSLCIKHEEDNYLMDHLDNHKKENIANSAGGGTIKRKHKEDSTKHTGKSASYKTSSVKVEMVHNNENEKHPRNLQLVEMNEDLGVIEPTEFESGFSDVACAGFDQETSNVEISETYNEFMSNLCHVDLPQCQPELQNNTTPYCAECDKTFSNRGHLNRHQMAHTGLRPYKCTDCGKSFGKKYILSVHKRRHTGERPYICTICDRSFRQTGVLNRHLKTHMYVKS